VTTINGTSADIAERASRRLEKARRLTEGTFATVAVILAVILGMDVGRQYVEETIAPPVALAALAGLGLFGALYTRLVRAGLAGRTPVRELVLSGALAAVLSLMIFESHLWIAVGPVWASGAVLCLPGVRRIAAVCAGTGAVMATYTVIEAGERAHWYMWPTMFVLFTVTCGVTVTGNMAQKWLWEVMQEAHAAREAQARLAVTEERLRFARDLHDLLGHSLSLIAVKSELAIRMAEADPARAKAEMADVRQAARDALREVRAAVRGYRQVELDAEVAGVRAVLEAAGVRCSVPRHLDGLPPQVGTVLAWVVREGATNVLKHSDARRCDITLSRADDAVVLEMINDGARPASGDSGTGLTGLTERLATVGGTLTAEHIEAGRFLLRATVPLPGEPAADDEPLRSVA